MQETDIFSQRLLQKMREHGYNQESLAERLGCSHSTVSRWTNGSKPRKMVAHQLASILEVTTSWLLGDSDDSDPVNLEQVKSNRSKRTNTYASEEKEITAAWQNMIAVFAKDLPPSHLVELSGILVEHQPPGYEILHKGLNALLKKKLAGQGGN